MVIFLILCLCTLTIIPVYFLHEVVGSLKTFLVELTSMNNREKMAVFGSVCMIFAQIVMTYSSPV